MINIGNNQAPYIVQGSNEAVECWSSKRLPFEPTGWMKEMREDVKLHLRSLSASSGDFYASYTSDVKAYFDLENVLFYNIGDSAFSKPHIRHLVFEHVPERPHSYDELGYQHHYLYRTGCIPRTYWHQTEIIASWEDVYIPKLMRDTRVHWIWYWMKKAEVEVKKQLGHFEPIGLRLTVKIPRGNSLSIVSILKPLLDGIISALHYHHDTDCSTAISRLSSEMNVSIDELDRLVKLRSQAALGPRDLVRPYRKFVIWNPADDRLVHIDIDVEDSADHKWNHSGTLFKVQSTEPEMNKRSGV